MTKYKQCLLRKDNVEYRAFIPSKFAVVGKTVKVRTEGSWNNGWKVVESSPTELDENHLPDYHDAIKGHRKATGDSQSKDKSKRLNEY